MQERGYSIINKLGEGAYGSVYLSKNKNGDSVAIKVVDRSKFKEDYAEQYVITEIESMEKINSDFVVKMIEFFEDEDSIYIVMEKLDQNLFQYLSEYSQKQQKVGIEELEAREIIYQVLKGMIAIHENGYTHRDLKPENILVHKEKKIFKITDFGLAKQAHEQMKTLAGTEQFQAPEILNEIPYDFKCDIWSIGVIYFILIFGIKPFNTLKNVLQVVDKLTKDKEFDLDSFIWTDDRRMQKKQNISKESKQFFKEVFTYDYKKRIDFKGIMNLPFVTQLPSYQKENSEISLKLSLYSQFEKNIIEKQKAQQAREQTKQTNSIFDQFSDAESKFTKKKIYEPLQNNEKMAIEVSKDELLLNMDLMSMNSVPIIKKKKKKIESLDLQAIENFIKEYENLKEPQFKKEFEILYLERQRYFFLKQMETECLEQKDFLQGYKFILPYMLTKCRIFFNREVVESLENKENKLSLPEYNFNKFLQSQTYSLCLKTFKQDLEIGQFDLKGIFSNIDTNSLATPFSVQNITDYVHEKEFYEFRLPYRTATFNVSRLFQIASNNNPIFFPLTLKLVICAVINRIFHENEDYEYTDVFLTFYKLNNDVKSDQFIKKLNQWISQASSDDIKSQIKEIMEFFFNKK